VTEGALRAGAPAGDDAVGVKVDEAVGGDVEHRDADVLLAGGGVGRLGELELGEHGRGDVAQQGDVLLAPGATVGEDAHRAEHGAGRRGDRHAEVAVAGCDGLAGRDDAPARVQRNAPCHGMDPGDGELRVAEEGDRAEAGAGRGRGETGEPVEGRWVVGGRTKRGQHGLTRSRSVRPGP
jgi:hypothetical protein